MSPQVQTQIGSMQRILMAHLNRMIERCTKVWTGTLHGSRGYCGPHHLAWQARTCAACTQHLPSFICLWSLELEAQASPCWLGMWPFLLLVFFWCCVNFLCKLQRQIVHVPVYFEIEMQPSEFCPPPGGQVQASIAMLPLQLSTPLCFEYPVNHVRSFKLRLLYKTSYLTCVCHWVWTVPQCWLLLWVVSSLFVVGVVDDSDVEGSYGTRQWWVHVHLYWELLIVLIITCQKVVVFVEHSKANGGCRTQRKLAAAKWFKTD